MHEEIRVQPMPIDHLLCDGKVLVRTRVACRRKRNLNIFENYAGRLSSAEHRNGGKWFHRTAQRDEPRWSTE